MTPDFDALRDLIRGDITPDLDPKVRARAAREMIAGRCWTTATPTFVDLVAFQKDPFKVNVHHTVRLDAQGLRTKVELDALAEYLTDRPERYLALRPFKHGTRGREGVSVAGINCLGYDADVQGLGHAKSTDATNFPTWDAVRDFLLELATEYVVPTWVLNTGGGVQFVFDLDALILREHDPERYADVHKLGVDLNNALQNLARKHGGKLDNVHDDARVLRVAGGIREKKEEDGKLKGGRHGPVAGVRLGGRLSVDALRDALARLDALDGPKVEEVAGSHTRAPKTQRTTARKSAVGGGMNGRKVVEVGKRAQHVVERVVRLLPTSSTLKSDAGGPTWTLEVCPCCRGLESAGTVAKRTAWVTATGWLKCWRETCRAGAGAGRKVDTRDGDVAVHGIHARDWIRDRIVAEANAREMADAIDELDAIVAVVDHELDAEGARRERATVESTPTIVPDRLADAQERTRAAILEALSVEGVGVVQVSTGVGKTHAAIELVRAGALPAGSVVLAFPTHDLLRQAIRPLEASGVPVVVLEGVGTACAFKARYRELGSPADWKQVACKSCPHRSTCGAMRTPKVGQVIACTVAHLESLAKSQDNGPDDPSPLRGRRLIVDEAPDSVSAWSLSDDDVARSSRNAMRHGAMARHVRLATEYLHGVLEAAKSSEAWRSAAAAGMAHGVSVHGDELVAIAAKVESVMRADSAALALASDRRLRSTVLELEDLAVDRLTPAAFRIDGGGVKVEDLRGQVDARRRAIAANGVREVVAQLARSTRSLPANVSASALRGDGATPLDAASLPHPDLLLVVGAMLASTKVDPAARPAGCTVEVVVRNNAAGEVVAAVEVRRRRDWRTIRSKVDGMAILDATAADYRLELDATCAGLPVRTFEVAVEPDAPRRFWRSTRRGTRRTMREESGGGLGEDAVQVVRATLRDAMAAFGIEEGESARVGLLTFQHVARIVQTMTPEARRAVLELPDGVDLEVGYYGRDDRGSRRFEDVDGLVVLGDPTPNLGAIDRDARCLGVQSVDLLDARRRRTVAQALGRAREVRRDVPVLFSGHALPSCWAAGTFQLLEARAGRATKGTTTAARRVALRLLHGGLAVSWDVVEGLGEYPTQPLLEREGEGEGASLAVVSDIRQTAERAWARTAAKLVAEGHATWRDVPTGTRGRPKRVLVRPDLPDADAEVVARRAVYLGAAAFVEEWARLRDVVLERDGAPAPVQAVVQPLPATLLHETPKTPLATTRTPILVPVEVARPVQPRRNELPFPMPAAAHYDPQDAHHKAHVQAPVQRVARIAPAASSTSNAGAGGAFLRRLAGVA
jgi:hypothetical protein